MKHTTRLAIFLVIGIPLTALLMWTAIPVILGGSVQGIIVALYWAIYTTAFFLFFTYIRYRDPRCGWYILATILFVIPFATAQTLFNVFFDLSLIEIHFYLVTIIEALLILWFVEPRLKDRFPERKSPQAILIEHGHGGDYS